MSQTLGLERWGAALRRWLPKLMASGLLALAGCSARHYRLSADKEVYATINQKAPFVTNMEPKFTIEQTNHLDLSGLRTVIETNAFLGAAAASELGAGVLSLEEALALAVRYSRTYQDNKEQLFLTALSLTLARHQWTPLFSAGGSGSVNYERSTSDNLAENYNAHGTGSGGLDWLIRDIGKISVAATTDFLRYLAGSPNTVSSSQIGLTFTHPLLQNAGYQVELENLTQAERDLMYQLRSFVLFRKSFSVQTAAAYYGVLSNRDAARNSYLNWQSSRHAAERTRALAAEGRTTQTDLGRIEQQELSAENGWIDAVRTYQSALDNFKIQLGLPVEAKVVLDDRELAILTIRQPKMGAEDAIKVALAARPDYQTAADQVAYSARKVKVAQNQLKTQLDFVATGGLQGGPQNSGFARPGFAHSYWSAGANVNLPLDRQAERNNYRAALISQEQATRARDLLRDTISQQVRESWRSLEQARRNYEISQIGVKLAERRVEEQELLADLGRARALDQVDAQNALLSSKDQLTQALVSHTIDRLQFWYNLGILYIKDHGQWEDHATEETKAEKK